jgi:hypothetical protein
MKFKPINLKTANKFVLINHRHNKPSVGDKFRVGLFKDDKLIGIGQAGRPVARMLDDGKTVEIIRVCVLDGYKNACSMIYARLAKIARLMGYEKIITYTLDKESGSSLKALGAKQECFVVGRQWSRPKRPRDKQEVYFNNKIRWIL